MDLILSSLLLALIIQDDVAELSAVVRNADARADDRIWALRTLRRYPLERTRGLYVELLDHDDDVFIAEAMHRLAPLKDESVAARAGTILEAKHSTALKEAAVAVLRERGDAEAVQALLLARPRPTGRLRGAIVESLRIMKDPDAIAYLLEAVRRGPGVIGRELAAHAAALHPQATPALVSALADPAASVCAAAADALGERGDRRAVEPLRASARGGHEPPHLAAIDALAKLSAFRPLIELADSSDPIIRLWVITALADARAVEAVELFASSLARSDWRERAAAIRGLTRVRSKSSIGPLIERLDREEGRLKGDALEALRALTGQTFVADPDRWREWWSASKDGFRLPDTVAVGAVPPHSRRVIYCLDISNSMTGAKLEAMKQWLLAAVEDLPRGARFDVIFFNHRVRRWNRKTSESLGDALRTLRTGGQTNLFGALETALQDPEADTVYVLSDGAPSAGAVVEPEEILRRILRLNRTRQIAIHGVSKAPTEFLKRLAAENGGRIIVN